VEQVILTAKAGRRLGLDAQACFSGALLWPFFYPWPQRTPGLVEEGFAELGRRWRPILDACDEQGIDLCFELHPGEDLHDGVTFERFLDAVGGHPRANILYDPSHMVLQHLDYLAFIDHYHPRIRMFHVKDAEFRMKREIRCLWRLSKLGRQARPLPPRWGDGQIDFKAVFSKLAQYDFSGWAVLEWECALKDAQVGAAEGARFIRDHIIPVTAHAFDDFAGGSASMNDIRSDLGLAKT